MKLTILEPGDDFGDVLGAVAGAEENGVVGFDEDEIVDADGSDKFLCAPKIISARIERE